MHVTIARGIPLQSEPADSLPRLVKDARVPEPAVVLVPTDGTRDAANTLAAPRVAREARHTVDELRVALSRQATQHALPAVAAPVCPALNGRRARLAGRERRAEPAFAEGELAETGARTAEA